MEKINVLTSEQYDKFNESTDNKFKIKFLKKILGLPKDLNLGLGDTLIQIDDAQQFGVYKNTVSGIDMYYIVIKKIDKTLAFADSLYPLFE